jgi:hypothetical protein
MLEVLNSISQNLGPGEGGPSDMHCKFKEGYCRWYEYNLWQLTLYLGILDCVAGFLVKIAWPLSTFPFGPCDHDK